MFIVHITSKLNIIDNKISVADISHQKSCILLIKLLPVLQFTNASKQNTFNSSWIPDKSSSSTYKSSSSINSSTYFTWSVTKVFQKLLSIIVINWLKFYWNPTKF